MLPSVSLIPKNKKWLKSSNNNRSKLKNRIHLLKSLIPKYKWKSQSPKSLHKK